MKRPVITKEMFVAVMLQREKSYKQSDKIHETLGKLGVQIEDENESRYDSVLVALLEKAFLVEEKDRDWFEDEMFVNIGCTDYGELYDELLSGMQTENGNEIEIPLFPSQLGAMLANLSSEQIVDVITAYSSYVLSGKVSKMSDKAVDVAFYAMKGRYDAERGGTKNG